MIVYVGPSQNCNNFKFHNLVQSIIIAANAIKSRMSDKTLIIPNTESDITKEWIQNATGFVPEDGTITVTGNIQEGLGYLSSMCRVEFTSEGTEKRESFLVKLPPKSSIFMEFALESKVDQREIEFYSNARPQILSIAPELGNNLCKYYCSKITGADGQPDYNSMLVFEDLKASNYQNLNPESPNWKHNLEKVVTFCAKLQAAGVALEKSKGSTISELFPFCLGVGENVTSEIRGLKKMDRECVTRLVQVLSEQGSTEDVISACRKLSTCWEKIIDKVMSNGSRFPCLIHADMWFTNIMVNEKDKNSPIKVIDWQNLSCRDQTFDLAFAIFFCSPLKEINKQNVEYFLKFYFNAFNAACKQYGCEYSARNEKEFVDFFNTWGLGYEFMWCLLCVDVWKDASERKERLRLIMDCLHKEYNLIEFLYKECSE